MALATLGGLPFRLAPNQVSWTYTIKTNKTNTVGGRVVQAFGVVMSDITITGEFGVGGIPAQQEFLALVETWITNQIGTLSPTGEGLGQGIFNGSPLRFTLDLHNWDFQTYLVRYTQPGGIQSVDIDPYVVSPQWTITLFVIDASATPDQASAALAKYIDELATQFGWFPNGFQGNVGANQYYAGSPAAGQLGDPSAAPPGYVTNPLPATAPPFVATAPPAPPPGDAIGRDINPG
jgi:hypothetical protein